MRRVLRPAGMLSVSEHVPDPDFVTRTALRSRLQRHGFTLIAHEGPWWAYTATFRVCTERGARDRAARSPSTLKMAQAVQNQSGDWRPVERIIGDLSVPPEANQT